MEMPKLDIPTDNLYKFGAILSTILCIACIVTAAFLLNNFMDEMKQEMYNVSAFINNDKMNHINDKIFASNVNNFLEAKSKILYVSICVLGGLIGVSFSLSIHFYFLWYKKVQVHLDRLLELKLKKEEAYNDIAFPKLQIAGTSPEKKDRSKHKRS